MRGVTAVESGRDRKVFARDAGMGQVSFLSILAGTLVAFASFAILLAIAAAVLAAVGVDTANLTSNDWRQLGIVGGIVAALLLLVSYFFGGYIAGRMARRAGALNGGLVFLLALLIGVAVALLVGSQADTEAVAADLRVLGVPTSGSEYGDIGTVAGLAGLVAMLGGAILGGVVGERWHGKLTARALSPEVGPEASAREEMADAGERRRDAGFDRPWADNRSDEPDRRIDERPAAAGATQPVRTFGSAHPQPGDRDGGGPGSGGPGSTDHEPEPAANATSSDDTGQPSSPRPARRERPLSAARPRSPR